MTAADAVRMENKEIRPTTDETIETLTVVKVRRRRWAWLSFQLGMGSVSVDVGQRQQGRRRPDVSRRQPLGAVDAGCIGGQHENPGKRKPQFV
jgi:hypothetical protein